MGLLIPRTPEAEKRVRRAIDRLRQDDFFVDGESIILVGGVLSVRVQKPLNRGAAGIELLLGEGLELDASNELQIENLSGASKGDILVYDGTALQRLPVGFDGQVLTADSSAPLGVSWQDAALIDTLGAEVTALTGSAAAALAVDYAVAATSTLASSVEADLSAAAPASSAYSSAFSSAFS
jgi:hypothetical protein